MPTRHKAGRVNMQPTHRPPIPIPGYGQYVLKRGPAREVRPLARQPTGVHEGGYSHVNPHGPVPN